MSKKVVAIAFSDLHINNWSKFNKDNKRTLDHFKVLFTLKELSDKYKVPLLFCGDLFHKPEVIENGLLSLTINNLYDLYTTIKDQYFEYFKIYAISGNHDMSKFNSVEKPSPSWLKTLSKMFPYINCIDFSSVTIGVKGNMYEIFGVPYMDMNIGLNDYIKNLKLKKHCKSILLLHTDYPGAKDTDNSEVGSVENLNINLLSKFDLVLCGHIHKPQRLSKKVYMVGAPLQQRRTDRDCELGYCLIYDDLSVKFKSLDGFPKFIDVEKEEDVKDDGNYYTVLGNSVVVGTDNQRNIDTNVLSKRTLVRKYMRSIGEKDKEKKETLVELINKAENDTVR